MIVVHFVPAAPLAAATPFLCDERERRGPYTHLRRKTTCPVCAERFDKMEPKPAEGNDWPDHS